MLCMFLILVQQVIDAMKKLNKSKFHGVIFWYDHRLTLSILNRGGSTKPNSPPKVQDMLSYGLVNITVTINYQCHFINQRTLVELIVIIFVSGSP